MRPKAEVSPHRTVLVRWRRAPISPAPALGCDRKVWPARLTSLGLTSVEDHRDSRIASEALTQLLAEFRAIAADHHEPSAPPSAACSCALMALPSAGSGPRRGTQMALVDPLAITFLAVVVVMSRRSRDGPPLGRGGRETLPQHVPVPWGAENPKATDADGPASPERVMNDDSPDPVQGWVHSYWITPSARASSKGGIVRPSAFVDSSPYPSLSAGLRTWKWAKVELQSFEHPARHRATNAQRVRALVLRGAGASPRMLDHGAIHPSPRGSSTCQRSLARLPCRRAGGVVLRPNPVASSRLTDAYA
jgi:hypothetical protein